METGICKELEGLQVTALGIWVGLQMDKEGMDPDSGLCLYWNVTWLNHSTWQELSKFKPQWTRVSEPSMVIQACKPSMREAEAGGSLEFRNSSPAWTTWQNRMSSYEVHQNYFISICVSSWLLWMTFGSVCIGHDLAFCSRVGLSQPVLTLVWNPRRAWVNKGRWGLRKQPRCKIPHSPIPNQQLHDITPVTSSMVIPPHQLGCWLNQPGPQEMLPHTFCDPRGAPGLFTA